MASGGPGTLPRPVPTSTDKPYRVYRQRKRAKGDGWIPWDSPGGPGAKPRKPRRSRWGWRLFRYARRLAYVALLVAAIWGTIAFLSFRSAVEQRNAKVPRSVHAQLAPTDGPALTSARNILLLGSDTRPGEKRGRADSMMLVRVDVKARRYAMLSIPRDLRVPVPGYGQEKVNVAYAEGGPGLAVRTVRDYTGVEVHHYAEIDFDGFEELVNTLGGVCLDNPARIQSEPFDGRRWFFRKGEICLTGKRALAYARVRKNRLDFGESDLTRGQRQQAVLNAIADEIISVDSVRSPRDVPEAAVQPLTTDITAGEMLAFGLGRAWAKRDQVLHCRLGGELGMVQGESVLIGDDQNRATVRMWQGQIPALAPNTDINQFAPGCTRRDG